MPEEQAPNQKYRLKQDLYVFSSSETKDLEYRLFTKAELDEIVGISHSAGGIYEHDAENGCMVNHEHGCIGIDPGDPDPNWWEPYDPPELAPSTEYEVFAPNGTRILGTYERLTGYSILTGVFVNADGIVEPLYEGTTQVDWNDQRTAYMAGERAYVDADWCVWRESQLMYQKVRRDDVVEVGTETGNRVGALIETVADTEGGRCD